MDYRTTKQIVFGSIYSALVLGLIVWFYFLVVKPAPTCFDKKQNQNEEGVDCGGSCAQICLPANLEEISLVDDVSVFSPTKDKVTLLARLKNPNVSHGAIVSYSITIFDEKDQKIERVSETAVLYPSQVRYVIVPALDLPGGSDRVKRADFKLEKADWRPAELLPQPQVVLRDHEIDTTNKSFVRVLGNVVNSDILDVPRVTVISVFLNQFQAPVGAARTELNDFRSGETRPFTIVHPMVPSLSPQMTQVFISTD
ncbi:MAG: hypothetical protein AAB691_02305 [Patescibacteria group bacterium]